MCLKSLKSYLDFLTRVPLSPFLHTGKQTQKDQVAQRLQITIKPGRVPTHADFIPLPSEPMCPSL